MKRNRFLKEFLGALGAEEIIFTQETKSAISGTAIYAPDDPEEKQDFCWHVTEENVPDEAVLNLVELLRKKKLLSIDQIIISRSQLRQQYNQNFNTNMEQENFDVLLEKLESVEVRMVDEGNETDSFFIHE